MYMTQELELQVAVSHHMIAGTRTWVLCNIIKRWATSPYFLFDNILEIRGQLYIGKKYDVKSSVYEEKI